jgi:hypothetical protein
MRATILSGNAVKHIDKYFTTDDIKDTKKLIYYCDKHAAEIIFTNEIMSVCCFYELHNNQSQCYLSSIGKRFEEHKKYPIEDLTFYANDYTVELKDLNTLVRSFDDLFFDDGIKPIPDEQMLLGLWDLYNIMEEYLDSCIEAIVNYKPIYFRTVPVEEVKIRIDKKITLIEDYH